MTADSWPLFLYAKYTCDPNDIVKGLFQSPILVKVCHQIFSSSYTASLLLSQQAYKYLFTSPSSVSEDDAEGLENPRPSKRAKKALTATRANVALLIGLNSVTPRSIAYVAVQVCHYSLLMA